MNPTPATRARPRRVRPLVIVAVILVAVLALWVVGQLAGPPPQVQRPADREAAHYADGYLLATLNDIAQAHPADPLDAVEAALRSTGDDAPSSLGSNTLTVGETNGASIPVVVYEHWDDRSFSAGFWGGSYYGTACRVYTVADAMVTAESARCPHNTPDHPPQNARLIWDPDEGLAFPDDPQVCDYRRGELRC